MGTSGGPSARRDPARRLFFALWPDDAARSRLAAAVRDLVPQGAGRAQRPDQWHVTVQFLGDIDQSRVAAVLEAGAAASSGASVCELEFDRVEHWRRPGVLCLVATSIPEPLARLVHELRSELQRRGFTAEARPFRAHVTLARRIVEPPTRAEVLSLPWPVRALSLVQTVTDREGSRYVAIESWPVAR